ncbi:MAG: hypothetical protein P4L33_13190 [Capsulimonadaceae bacterium]|nr:hypothetical protein [Capsulimonadaceae bacterium]
MYIEQNAGSVGVNSFYYSFTLTVDRFQLLDPRTGHCLIDCPTPLIYRPEFAGGDANSWKCDGIDVVASGRGPVVVQVSGSAQGLPLVPVTLRCFEEYIELIATTSALSDDALIRYWSLFSSETHLDLFHVHHWRNRHGHTATYETYNLEQGARYGEELPDGVLPEMADQATRLTDLSTYSSDWQFAPRPSVLLLQRDNLMLGIGSRDLPNAFGLEMRSASRKLHHLRLNYGGDFGYPVHAGETVESPRFYIWLDHNGGVWDSVDTYVRLLRGDEAIPPLRDNHNEPHWWRQPQYCTWPDQGLLGGAGVYYNWMGDAPIGAGPVDSFNEAMLDYLIGRLVAEDLHVGSVIIDDGWEKIRGEWVAHPDRFPRLREQIDRIHAIGLKVLLWLAPLDFWPGADVLNHPDWLCGGGVLGRFGNPLVDYSCPAAQDGYLRPMMRYLFSDEPGCLNADGFKSDFMAEKVQPVYPVYDRTWRGEEPFILNTMALFHREMRRYKPDGMHLGCTAHPFFTQVQDAIRTYDVPASQLQHEDRALMLRHFNPGNLVSLDLSECRSLADIEQHIDIALRNNLLYQIPRIAQEPVTNGLGLGPDFMPLLRRKLRIWG